MLRDATISYPESYNSITILKGVEIDLGTKDKIVGDCIHHYISLCNCYIILEVGVDVEYMDDDTDNDLINQIIQLNGQINVMEYRHKSDKRLNTLLTIFSLLEFLAICILLST